MQVDEKPKLLNNLYCYFLVVITATFKNVKTVDNSEKCILVRVLENTELKYYSFWRAGNNIFVMSRSVF